MNYYVINLSEVKNDVTIKLWLENYHKYLLNNGIVDETNISFANPRLKEEVLLLNKLRPAKLEIGLVHFIDFVIEGNHKTGWPNELDVLNDCEFLELESFNKNGLESHKIIAIGGQLHTDNEWGDANNRVTVISLVEEYVLWHEVSHLLGVDEHYQRVNLKREPISECTLNTCVMRWAARSLELCDKALTDIRSYFNL